MRNQRIKTERSYLLALFGLPFFLVGAGFLFWSVIPTLYDAWRMQSWLQVEGQLLHAKLTVSHSDDSVTYGVEARYAYNILGRDFEHDRAAVNSGNDNIGDFQERLGRQLEALKRQGQPVTVYYNPADPQQAVLNRDVRWGLLGFKLIFVVVFGGVGAGLIYWALRGRKTFDIPEAKEKPWLSRPEWQNGKIRSGAKGGMYAIWGFATVWNLISLPAAFQITDIWRDEGPIALVVLLFPLVGIGMIYGAVKVTREWLRFGPTPLTLDPFPGAIGGDVGGIIRVNQPFSPDMVCRVTLSNILSYVSGSGKNRSRREEVKWQDDGYARILSEGRGTALQFRFRVPPGLTETEEAASRYHFWRLNVELDLDGVDLDRSFELPVYQTGGTSQRLDFLSPDEQPAGLPRISAEALLPVSQQGNARVLDYRILRKPGRSLGMLIFGSIFAGIGLFLWGEAAKEGFMLYLMSSIFGLAGFAIVLSAIYSAFNSLRVSMDGHNITSTRYLFGLPVNHHEYRYADVLAVESKEGMKSSTGNKHKIEYSIEARLPGTTITLAEHLDSASQARMVVDYFEDEFLRAGTSFEMDE